MSRSGTLWKGPNEAIPEHRTEVLQRMMEKVKESGVYRQNYSNGEFISRSTIISATEKGICNRGYDLDGAADEYHWDPAAQVFWRSGGSFD